MSRKTRSLFMRVFHRFSLTADIKTCPRFFICLTAGSIFYLSDCGFGRLEIFAGRQFRQNQPHSYLEVVLNHLLIRLFETLIVKYSRAKTE